MLSALFQIRPGGKKIKRKPVSLRLQLLNRLRLIAVFCQLTKVWCCMFSVFCQLTKVWCCMISVFCQLTNVWCCMFSWFCHFVVVGWCKKPRKCFLHTPGLWQILHFSECKKGFIRQAWPPVIQVRQAWLPAIQVLLPFCGWRSRLLRWSVVPHCGTVPAMLPCRRYWSAISTPPRIT